ncbi:MAG: UDP-N-acetylmuramoyl-tripeptide--D-alanyl-D-alanine ligase, partial [Candidatus Aegiribacteria sp.]|nr:UDP-N-acetylmuramoyl-tripeptide--D-alanyl-D-alanine ligase [Candidatus Aegiribacteria sp.]MBD3295432.1 UDP-N-acetylmuramoyl-tripeptide--D-alanyl-D-alanine ligase [Candidatus Fermentibacteria bacterium]
MILLEVAEAAGGRVHPKDAGVPVGKVVIDSRKADRGSLFFALKGSHTDGHEYVDQVLGRGGYAVVSRGGERRGVVLVEDVEQALFLAAERRREDIDSTVVAITGSSGKTTTRKMLAAVLRTKYSVYSTLGNLNNQLGLPLTILNSPKNPPRMMVLELGMNHAGELLRLGGLAKPDHCLVTNIGRAHMEFFSDLQG